MIERDREKEGVYKQKSMDEVTKGLLSRKRQRETTRQRDKDRKTEREGASWWD